MFGHAVLRVLLALVGYIVAIICAVAVITVAEWIRAYPPVAGRPDFVIATAMIVVSDGFLLFWLLGTMALLPALAVIVVAEALSLRSWLFYVAAGAGVVALLSRLLDPARVPALPAQVSVAVAAGLAGGLAYWLVAGRSAGRRLARQPAGAAVPPAA
jgi:hypothetical protein